MPLRPDLIGEIQNTLGQTAVLNLHAGSDPSDLYEAYLWCLVLGAAKERGASIVYQDVHESPATAFEFRTSPGHIWSRYRDYTHAVILFPNKPALEAHVGVKVAGRSGVLHECDIAVLDRDECLTCRREWVDPRSAKAVITIEAKFYSTNLKLHLGRSFMGLNADLGARHNHFVSNISSRSVARLLAHHRRNWSHDVSPLANSHAQCAVTELKSTFQREFGDYIARK